MSFLDRFSGQSLSAHAFRGTLLVGFSAGGRSVLRFISNLILTRLLFPEAFGLMALVGVVTVGLAMFSEMGIRASIIQDKRGKDPAFLNTAWTLQIGRGVLLWLATLALAVPAANFYEAPELAVLLPVAGLAAVFQGFNSTRMLTAQRDITLGRLTALNLGTSVFGLIVKILLAYLFNSVWALVVGSLASAFVLMLLTHVVLPGSPNRLRFERAAAKRLISFGKYIFLATVAGFAVNHADRAILGKMVPLEQLALYSIGFALASVPKEFGKRFVGNILFPLYARRPPSESPKNRRKINKARWLLSGAMIAAGSILAFLADPLVTFLYDERYEGAGPMAVLIALGFLPVLVTQSYQRLPMAAGHSGRFAFLVISLAVLQSVVMILGVNWFGLGGIALAPGIAAIAFYPILVFSIQRYKGWDLYHDVFYFIITGGVVAIVFATQADRILPLFNAP